MNPDILKSMIAGGFNPNREDGVEVRMDADGNMVVPTHLRPHYNPNNSDTKFENKFADLKNRLNTLLAARSVSLSDTDFDQLVLKLHHAMHFLDITPDGTSGKKGGRPRNIGADELAKDIKQICEKYSLPASGSWNGSLSTELLTMVEELADAHLKKRSITSNPARRMRNVTP